MSDMLLKKAEGLINKCTAHTRESGLTFDWVMALTDEFGYPSAFKRQMWYDELAEHFNKPEDDCWCVLMFKPERYNIFIDFQTIYGEFSHPE